MDHNLWALILGPFSLHCLCYHSTMLLRTTPSHPISYLTLRILAFFGLGLKIIFLDGLLLSRIYNWFLWRSIRLLALLLLFPCILNRNRHLLRLIENLDDGRLIKFSDRMEDWLI